MQYPLFADWLFLSAFLVEKYRGNSVLIYQNEISIGDPRTVLTEQKAACGYALLMVMAAFCESAEAFVWIQFGKTGYLKCLALIFRRLLYGLPFVVCNSLRQKTEFTM